MKKTLFVTMLAAALMGGQVFAEQVYRISEQSPYSVLNLGENAAKIIIDAQVLVMGVQGEKSPCLTLDHQINFPLASSYYMTLPSAGVLNITSSVNTVSSTWEDSFSVEGGGSIMVCFADAQVAPDHGTVQFFGKGTGETVTLGNTEVMFMGVVEDLSALDMNQVGVVWGSNEIDLVGKVQKSVPEPTTGSLSLLALAGLAVRRRRK